MKTSPWKEPYSPSRGQAFIIKRENAIIKSEPDTYIPQYESPVQSYHAIKAGKNIIIYETFRKGKKPKRIKSYKDSTYASAIKAFKEEPYKLRTSENRASLGDRLFFHYNRYQNYRPRKEESGHGSNTFQLQALVQVINKHTKKGGLYVAYSKRALLGHREDTTEEQYEFMDNQARGHAIASRIHEERGNHIITDEEYQQNLLLIENKKSLYHAEIIDRRYIIRRTVPRRTKLAKYMGADSGSY